MEKMENLPVRRQIDRAGFFHGCADVFARDLPRPGAQRDSSPAGDALDMRAANGNDRVAHRLGSDDHARHTVRTQTSSGIRDKHPDFDAAALRIGGTTDEVDRSCK